MTPHRSVVRALSRHCQGATLTSRRSRSSMRPRTMVSSRSDQVRVRGTPYSIIDRGVKAR